MAQDVIHLHGRDLVVREDAARAFRGVHWADCSRIHGPLIWAWARKFTDSTSAAETVTFQILDDISDSAEAFDTAKSSEITFIKQICIRGLMGVTAG